VCFSTSPRSLPRRATPELGWNVIAALGQAINLDVEKLLWQRASDICDFHATRILTERDGMGCRARTSRPLPRASSKTCRTPSAASPCRPSTPTRAAPRRGTRRWSREHAERSVCQPPPPPHNGFFRAWQAQGKGGQGGLERGRGGRGRRGPGGAGPSRHAGRGRWAPAATRSGIGGNGTTS